MGDTVARALELLKYKSYWPSVRNVASGGLGNWARSHIALFRLTASDENLRAFAHEETVFFQNERGLTRWAGGMLTSEERVLLLKAVRDGDDVDAAWKQIVRQKWSFCNV